MSLIKQEAWIPSKKSTPHYGRYLPTPTLGVFTVAVIIIINSNFDFENYTKYSKIGKIFEIFIGFRITYLYTTLQNSEIQIPVTLRTSNIIRN